MASPCAPPQGARFHGSDGIAHYEFEWDFSALQPNTNDNGTSGFARVISRSSGGGGLIVGYLGRVHRCAWNPCRAVYPRSKYGYVGPPLHIQPSDWKPPAGADAEAASKPPPAAPPEPPAATPPKEPVSPLTPPKESTAAVAAEAAAVAVPSELLEPPTPPRRPQRRAQGHPLCLVRQQGNRCGRRLRPSLSRPQYSHLARQALQ